MYQLIIVNDRNMNRVSLATYVEWEYLGFQIAGKFQNMESAVSFIQENPVDAILTFMTPYQNIGAEITRYVRDHYPRIKVVMIGDAPGDCDAAEKNHVHYYPILVNHEKESWDEAIAVGFGKLQSGEYAEYGAEMKQKFLRNLGG